MAFTLNLSFMFRSTLILILVFRYNETESCSYNTWNQSSQWPYHPPITKIITKRFYELSLKLHPDRPGGDIDACQKITEAYRILGDLIEENYEPKIYGPEEELARHAFRHFNFDDIKENLNSFTSHLFGTLSWLNTKGNLLNEKLMEYRKVAYS